MEQLGLSVQEPEWALRVNPCTKSSVPMAFSLLEIFRIQEYDNLSPDTQESHRQGETFETQNRISLKVKYSVVSHTGKNKKVTKTAVQFTHHVVTVL